MTTTTTDVIAYTDGGCRGNPGPGGWGAILIDPKTGAAREMRGGERDTTNNRMEMLAAIEALKALAKPGLSVLVHSDSQYVIKACTEWMPGWKAKGWKKSGGPLKNVDLLKELDRLLAIQRVRWQWVKGHDGNPGNERVDQLANDAMDALANGEDPTWEQRGTWKG